MADELLDQVDKDDNVIGTVWKSEAHRDLNIIHREVAVCLFSKKGEVLLAQRSFDKKNDPGAWKMTSAGHPLSGESPETAVKRELFEELGINVDPVFYGKYFSSHNIQGENQESRFTWLYYALLDEYPKTVLQKSEINDAKWVKVQDLSKFAIDNKYNLNSNSHKKIIEIAKFLKLFT